MVRQRTLNRMVRASGVGLHTGKQVCLTLHPADENTGAVFCRSDITGSGDIPARIENVHSTALATTLSCPGEPETSVATVEHLMAAFAGMGIDNVRVEVDAGEVPIMDGSASDFVFLIEAAGICEQSAPKRFLRVLREVSWSHGDARATLSPHEGLRISYNLLYDHPVFDQHPTHASVDFSSTAFVTEVARARTFGFLNTFQELRANNLILGGSLDNAVVVDDDRILNDGGLRCRDEFVKHKILDAIGDMYLLPCSLIGAFDGYKSGHQTNNMLFRKLLATPDAYEIVTFEGEQDVSPVCHAWSPVVHSAAS